MGTFMSLTQISVMLCFRIWLCASFFLALGCGAGAEQSPTDAAKDEATRSAIEERLIMELAPTDDREGRQRNAIINRAIDGNFDVYAAPEGYFYEIIDSGSTVGFAEGDYVATHYRGSFLDGRVFDDSRRRGDKLSFRLGDLIPAWNLAIPRVKNGGSIRIFAPSELAYGADGLAGPRGDTLVPAHSVLEFVIQDVESVEPPDGM